MDGMLQMTLDATRRAFVTVGAAQDTGVHPFGEFCTASAAAIQARTPRWYCVPTKPGQEKIAADRLRAQGFAVCCPMVDPPLRRRDRQAMLTAIARAAGKRMRGRPPKPKAPEPVPALRGYVFVHVDLQRDAWGCIRSTIGVASSEERSVFLCMVPGQPYPIPDRQIEALQREVMTAGRKADLVKALLEANEVVRIADGPFTSFDGRVIEQRGDDVWLYVEIFGRSTPLQLKVGQVERAGDVA